MPTVAGPTQSRYAGTAGVPDNTDSLVTSQANGNTAQTTSGAQSGVTTSQGTQTGTSTTNNMSSKSTAALDQLIAQLLSGGTPDMKAAAATRRNEVQTVGAQREGYSKEAAFGDAQGLISQQLRRTLETLLPSINRAAEDAGSSGGALRALLLQDAAQRAAESSSALGVQTAVQYGGVTANMDQVMEKLTASDPTATNALINALAVSKGANSTTNSTVNNSTVGTSQQATTQQSNTATTENKRTMTDYVPFANQGGGGLAQYGGGAASDAGKYVGTTADTLAALNGDKAWSGYTF